MSFCRYSVIPIYDRRERDDDISDAVDDFRADATAATVRGLTMITHNLPAEQEGDVFFRGRKEVGSLLLSEFQGRHGYAHLYILTVCL